MPTPYLIDSIHGFIRAFGEASDNQLAAALSKKCAEFPPDASLDDSLVFLRDLRDECVFIGGASHFMMTAIAILVEGYPETEEAMNARRTALDERHGGAMGWNAGHCFHAPGLASFIASVDPIEEDPDPC
jgi:hypothetical protein